jgi:hypothetical protein
MTEDEISNKYYGLWQKSEIEKANLRAQLHAVLKVCNDEISPTAEKIKAVIKNAII